jgi:RimJ/RimL family protein N-acetyltransferase
MLETERLILRRWLPRDLAPFAALNGDPEVRRHFPTTLERAESDALVARFEDSWEEDGFGLAAAERKEDGAFVGMVGLSRVRFAPLEGAVEVGWRLGRAHWGRGYATEAARAWLGRGFGAMRLAEVIAFTVPANVASRRVMERLGMRHDPARDFEHPALPDGHPLKAHVLYAGARGGWT